MAEMQHFKPGAAGQQCSPFGYGVAGGPGLCEGRKTCMLCPKGLFASPPPGCWSPTSSNCTGNLKIRANKRCRRAHLGRTATTPSRTGSCVPLPATSLEGPGRCTHANQGLPQVHELCVAPLTHTDQPSHTLVPRWAPTTASSCPDHAAHTHHPCCIGALKKLLHILLNHSSASLYGLRRCTLGRSWKHSLVGVLNPASRECVWMSTYQCSRVHKHEILEQGGASMNAGWQGNRSVCGEGGGGRGGFWDPKFCVPQMA